MRTEVRVGPVAVPLLAGGLLAAELVVLGMYLLITDWDVLVPRYLLYPLIWITVGILAIVRTSSVDSSWRSRLLAAWLAVGYLLVLLWVDGSVSLHGTGTGFRIAWLPPGWGPALFYGGDSLSLALFPYRVVGYTALAYLVYTTVATASRRVLGGLVGLVSCVSCTLPVVAALLSSVIGGSVAVTDAATVWSYELSTVAFLGAIVLLYWRPLPGGRLSLLVSRQ